MELAWFLEQRVSFIRQQHIDSMAPFAERMRLIEAKKSLLEPPYSEDGEAAFLAEWIDASDSVHVLDHACVSMLAGVLHVDFERGETEGRCKHSISTVYAERTT